jgi:hypothetical protein
MALYRVYWVNEYGQEAEYLCSTNAERDAKMKELYEKGVECEWEFLGNIQLPLYDSEKEK